MRVCKLCLILVAGLILLSGCRGGSGQSENTGVAPQPVKGAPQGYGPPGGAAGPPPSDLAPKSANK
jgi:hypothetical protein